MKLTGSQKTAIARRILRGLEKQKFADWYNTGDFDNYIRGEYPDDDPRQPTPASIENDIKDMFLSDL